MVEPLNSWPTMGKISTVLWSVSSPGKWEYFLKILSSIQIPQTQSSCQYPCRRRNTWKRKLTLKASLEQRSQRLTIQVNCYHLDSVVCFLKVVFSALILLLLNMVNLYKWGKHFCKLWRCTNCFLYQCKWHSLVPVSSRYVKLVLTYGTQVQLFWTMLNDYTGEHPSYSKKISLSSKKVLTVKQRAFLFGSSKDIICCLLKQSKQWIQKR